MIGLWDLSLGLTSFDSSLIRGSSQHYGNGTAILDGLRPRFAGSPVGSHVAYRPKILRIFRRGTAAPLTYG